MGDLRFRLAHALAQTGGYQGRSQSCADQFAVYGHATRRSGPRPEDGVCTLRGKDVARILKAEFGVRFTVDGACRLLHRLYSALRPRPRHENR